MIGFKLFYWWSIDSSCRAKLWIFDEHCLYQTSDAGESSQLGSFWRHVWAEWYPNPIFNFNSYNLKIGIPEILLGNKQTMINMEVGNPEEESLYNRIKSDTKIFTNINFILDKINNDGYFESVASTFASIFSKEMEFAISGKNEKN